MYVDDKGRFLLVNFFTIQKIKQRFRLVIALCWKDHDSVLARFVERFIFDELNEAPRRKRRGIKWCIVYCKRRKRRGIEPEQD